MGGPTTDRTQYDADRQAQKDVATAASTTAADQAYATKLDTIAQQGVDPQELAP